MAAPPRFFTTGVPFYSAAADCLSGQDYSGHSDDSYSGSVEPYSYITAGCGDDELFMFELTGAESDAKLPSIETPLGPIVVVDTWNLTSVKDMRAKIDNPSAADRVFFQKHPDIYARTKMLVEEHRPRTLDARLLRDNRPDHIPVILEMDARCSQPVAHTKIYQVPGFMKIGALVHVFREEMVRVYGPVKFYVQNTQLPIDALMSEIDEKYKDPDGFVHVTYCGKFREELKRTAAGYWPSKPIGVLDWNMTSHKPIADARSIDAWNLRANFPDHIPVTVYKDSSSDVPDIPNKKYHVPVDMALREFVDHIQRKIWWTGNPKKQRIFVYFKKTVPAAGALMSAVDEDNRDESDGFLHIVYGGEVKVGMCSAPCEEL